MSYWFYCTFLLGLVMCGLGLEAGQFKGEHLFRFGAIETIA